MFFEYFLAFILTSQYHQYFLYVMIIWYNSGISNFHHSKPHYGSLYLPSFLYPGIFTIFAVSYIPFFCGDLRKTMKAVYTEKFQVLNGVCS